MTAVRGGGDEFSVDLGMKPGVVVQHNKFKLEC